MNNHAAIDRPARQVLIAAAGALLLILAIAIVPAAHAGAPTVQLEVTLADDATQETFDVEVILPDDNYECDSTEFTLNAWDSGDEVAVDIVDGGDDSNLTGTFSASDLDPALYELEVECDLLINGDGGGVQQAFTGFSFSRITIDKQVEGDVPDDASFTVRSACEETIEEGDSWNVDVAFGADGGTQPFLVQMGLEGPGLLCVVTETEDGGADETVLENAELTLDEPTSETTTVTNTFPEAEEPEEEEEEPEAEAAEPVEEEPDFTG